MTIPFQFVMWIRVRGFGFMHARLVSRLRQSLIVPTDFLETAPSSGIYLRKRWKRNIGYSISRHILQQTPNSKRINFHFFYAENLFLDISLQR